MLLWDSQLPNRALLGFLWLHNFFFFQNRDIQVIHPSVWLTRKQEGMFNNIGEFLLEIMLPAVLIRGFGSSDRKPWVYVLLVSFVLL